MPRRLAVEPLTRDAFAPFGQLLQVGGAAGASANQGTAVRYDWAGQLANGRAGAKPNLVVVRCEARALPLLAKLVERHPHSSQTFVPMACRRYLVCVAPPLPGGGPDVQRLRAFVAAPGQGINYSAGTWHHPMAALDAPADFAMLVWEDGGPGDCEEFPLPEPVELVEG